ncbi:hypothetical protein BTO06_13820 [Tenacibaculum sp. SZ-18]|uniref:hypothetical protein n=1 Tax=Tenacibaculum sp. SZ-18 TaxID=754423 RepID=UPI000C2D46EA|nr:hypothetical protein [Tenacibaculum sp. SZ-18]AUC16172.1 hypothetical protein BTO06_13820 [Tenacibaculum sp. SZ-18]
MKNKFLLAILISFWFTNDLIGQNSTPVESSLGLSYQFSTISEGYDYGIGLIVNNDLGGSSDGFGYIAQLTYLAPVEAIEDVIDYALTFDALIKYDIAVADGLDIAPTAGVGYLTVQSEASENAEFYFSAGGTLSYFISDSIVIGFDVTKQFLEGSDITTGVSIRFQI